MNAIVPGIDIALAEGEDGVGMPQVTYKPLLILLPGLDGTGKLFTDFLEALGAVAVHCGDRNRQIEHRNE